MDAQLKKGILEAYVLSLLSKKTTYGYELFYTISTNIKISENSLYPIFRRLELQGLLETYSEEHSGRLRKYYKITKDGAARLEEYQNMLLEIRGLINNIIGEKND